MTTYELASYLARRMVAEGYSEADAIDAEAMILRHLAAVRKRSALSDYSFHPRQNVSPSTGEAGE